MKNQFLVIATMLGLVACDGPWNTMPSDAKGGDPVLRLSFFAVGGKDFDTLWLERTQPLAGKYDSTVKFVESATITVSRTDDATDSVSYRQVPGSAVAWVPVRAHRVSLGASYTMRASVRWNAAKNWPTDSDIRTTSLEATTRVPSEWSISDSVFAPVEALVPALSAGALVTDSATLLRELDSMVPGAVARWKLTSATLDSLRAGIPTVRRISYGDTTWYISDISRRVTNAAGQSVGLAYREYRFHPRFGEGFGGVFGVEGFDPSASYILDPVRKALRAAVGRGASYETQDSAQFYQPGNTRYYFGPYRAYAPELYGWPELLMFSNVGIGYTGLNKLFFYAVDPKYVSYNEALQSISQGDRTAVEYTNVKGGKGYFAGALVDSFAFHVRAVTADTFSVEALRGASCRRAWQNTLEDGRSFDSLVACKGVDFRAAPSSKTRGPMRN
jgi:hypothetical protein